MSALGSFGEFLTDFFHIFAGKSFRGGDYLDYLRRPSASRGGDEASIVDTAIIGPLLGLLGFEPAERVYNYQRQNERPDFAPRDSLYGTCFIVEDKSTSIPLDFDQAHPESHLSQLLGYMRSAGIQLGLLTNGVQLTAWRLVAAHQPEQLITIDLPDLILAWQQSDASLLPSTLEKPLRDLFDLYHKKSFTDPDRLEKEIAVDLEQWRAQALPLDTQSGHQSTLVEALQTLIKDLQLDAQRILEQHLARYTEYTEQVQRFSDTDFELASRQLKLLQEKILSILRDQFQLIWGLAEEEITAIEEILANLERNAKLFLSPKDFLSRVLTIINTARLRKYAGKPRLARPMLSLDEFPALSDPLKNYIDRSFAWHQRQATLRHDYRKDIEVYDDYASWQALLQETALGALDEQQQRGEFSLQAAYVVFIRLLLIRVCEDKGVFPHRFLSDGGLKHWQEDIERYFIFARGNPYSPLLNIAYENAQNVYAHFFTGRELFNWYQLDKKRFILSLYQLGRFNFANVDADIIGTIYNTYVNREEKRNKGQYYTPPEIVRYILDTVGYTGTNVIGSHKRLIDPACGSGTFLVTAARRLVAAYQGTRARVDDPVAVLERIQQSLFGFDLNPFACYLAEMNLLIQILDLVKEALATNKDVRLKPFHIYNVDALTRPNDIYYYMNLHTLQAEENDEVNQIKSRAADSPYAQGFAFVVANPPYGATLSDSYKKTLRENWSEIFYGQPDTYTFFLKLGLELLGPNGKLGFITPNTYLMGRNTAMLRSKLLNAGRIEQIVDLPQGIWPDATVDCVLLFLAAEQDDERRLTQKVQVHLLGLQDKLGKLTQQEWRETLTQQQIDWLSDADYKINIRRNEFIYQIENACRISVDDGSVTKVQRLGDLTQSSQGVIVYGTSEASQVNPYIKSRRDAPPDDDTWKPLLDSDTSIGRYNLHWGKSQPYVKYGNWLYRPREVKFFEAPKILLIRLRNKSLPRRLIATYDNAGFINRDNFNNIIAKDTEYDLKYILALFNSSLLNYWYSRLYDNVNINPDYFRQLPIHPADTATQAIFVSLVDAMLAKHAELNTFRAQGYTIKTQRDGAFLLDAPYDTLLHELRAKQQGFPVLTLYDAKVLGLLSISDSCDLTATISKNVFVPTKYPASIVLRHNKLWLEVPDAPRHRYFHNYLKRPQWQGKTWDEIKNSALLPENDEALQALFTLEQEKLARISTLLNEIHQIDDEIDNRVLDLYGITNPADRQRILGSAPVDEDDEAILPDNPGDNENEM